MVNNKQDQHVIFGHVILCNINQERTNENEEMFLLSNRFILALIRFLKEA